MKLGKRKRFLLENPYCCFCGGSEAAVSLDHVPNRACFHGRNYPHGFEFPACGRCQNKSRADEQAFALMCHLSDRNPANYDKQQSLKMLEGIRNNRPELFPRAGLSANEKRKGLRWLGQHVPAGMSLSDVPIVELSRDFDPILKRVTAKISLALYYRHMGRAVPLTHFVSCFWTQAVNLRQMQGFVEVGRDLQFREEGWRPNIDLGDRFSYLWNRSLDDTEPDTFVAIAQFGQGLVICALLVEQGVPDKGDEDWIAVQEFVENSASFNRRMNPLLLGAA